MFRLLMLTAVALALGSDTCLQGDNGDCIDESSAMQVKHSGVASEVIASEFIGGPPEEPEEDDSEEDDSEEDDSEEGSVPEPSKQCQKKMTQAVFNGFEEIAQGLVQAGTASLGDVEKTKEYSHKVWGSWYGCDTFADLNLTGSVQGLNTTSVTNLECIETNKLNTKFQIWVEVKMDVLTFAGTGTSFVERSEKCLMGDKYIPELSATFGATLKNITLSALVDVASMKVTNASDVHFSYDKITDFKCGAITEPINLNFINEMCSFFLTPIANLFKKPTVWMINKALNKAIEKQFAGNSSVSASNSSVE